MEIVSFNIDASKASRKVSLAIEKLFSESQKALADGFQPGKDIPQILLSCYGDVLSAWSDFAKIKEDAKEDLGLVLNGLATLPSSIVGVLVDVKKLKEIADAQKKPKKPAEEKVS